MKTFLVFVGWIDDPLNSVLDQDAFLIEANSFEEAARLCDADLYESIVGNGPFHQLIFLYHRIVVLDEEDPLFEENKDRKSPFFRPDDKLVVCHIGTRAIVCALSDLNEGRLELSIVELPSVVSFPVHSAQNRILGALDY